LTRAAREFIQPLTFASLTGRKVITELFPPAAAQDTLASAIEHIAVARENDIWWLPSHRQPAGQIRLRLADDFLTTVYLAFTGQVVLALP